MPVLAILALAGCAPNQDDLGDEVPDINVSIVGSADEALTVDTYTHVDTEMNQLMSQLDANGCAVGFAIDGEVVHLQTYGDAVKKTLGQPKEPWTVRTVAPVASVSKTITALGILRLQDQGLLDVDDEIGDYLDHGIWKFFDIYRLLNHTSHAGGATKFDASAPGFGPGVDPNAYSEPHPMAHPRLAHDAYWLYTIIAPPDPAIPDDPTGTYTTGVYSNVGYSIAGAIIDELTHDDPLGWANGYERYLWQEIGRGTQLEQGGMATMALSHSWRATDIPNLSQGYDALGPVPSWSPGNEEGWYGPSGGWAMTIGDLTRLASLIDQREILSVGSWNEATTPSSWVLGAPYGYGMWVEDIGSWTRLSHGGDNVGSSAVWAVYEDHPTRDDFAIGIQCNVQNSGALLDTADDIYEDYIGGLLDAPAAAAPQTAVGTQAIDGTTFALDTSAAHTDVLGIDPSQIDASLAVSIAVTRAGSLDVALRDTDGGPFTTVTWADTSFGYDPNFLTGEQTVSLPTVDYGAVRVEQARLAGVFSDGGDSVDIELSGLWDTRTLTAPVDLCAMAEDRGTLCEPCADGAAFCLDLTLSGLAGTATR